MVKSRISSSTLPCLSMAFRSTEYRLLRPARTGRQVTGAGIFPRGFRRRHHLCPTRQAGRHARHRRQVGHRPAHRKRDGAMPAIARQRLVGFVIEIGHDPDRPRRNAGHPHRRRAAIAAVQFALLPCGNLAAAPSAAQLHRHVGHRHARAQYQPQGRCCNFHPLTLTLPVQTAAIIGAADFRLQANRDQTRHSVGPDRAIARAAPPIPAQEPRCWPGPATPTAKAH